MLSVYSNEEDLPRLGQKISVALSSNSGQRGSHEFMKYKMRKQ